MPKKRGKYKTDFEHQNFDIPVSTEVNDKQTNISKTVYFEHEAANIAIKSIEKELTEKNLKLKQKENSFQQQTESSIAKHEKTMQSMLEIEKLLKTQLKDWKKKSKILRYENLLLNRKRGRNEANLTIAKKYPKLLKDFDTLEKKRTEIIS